MNEAEWNSCTDPEKRLLFVRNGWKASERKLRLFGCACVRRIWSVLTDDRSTSAAEVEETGARRPRHPQR